MAYFEKLASGGTRAHVQIKGQRDSATFPNKREAQLWAAQREIEFRTIAKGQAGSIRSTHDAFARYSEEVAITHKGAHWEQIRLAKFTREFPRVILNKLTTEHVQLWRDTRLTQVGPASVLREIHLLSSVFEQCRKEWRWLMVNPCKDVRKPASPQHRTRTLTRHEIKLMLRALGYPARTLPRHAVAYALLLALRTGMRQGELAAIQWRDVADNYVRLPDTKNGTSRDVPLSAKAKHILAKMRGYDGDSVFNTTSARIDALFRAAKTRAGLSGFVWHDSRHTAATWIGKSGKLQIMELCKMFGWSDPKMAMIYFNPSADDLASKL